jgi:SH3-like domain-containing protein
MQSLKMKPYAWMIMILLLLFSSVAWAERLAVAVSVANVRSGPGKNYDILWEIEQYHPLNVFKKSGQWYHFRDFEGDEGWIYKSLVRNIPSITFKVIKRKESWIYIQHADGDKGWIYKSLVW